MQVQGVSAGVVGARGPLWLAIESPRALGSQILGIIYEITQNGADKRVE